MTNTKFKKKFLLVFIVDTFIIHLLQFTFNIKHGTHTHYVGENGGAIVK